MNNENYERPNEENQENRAMFEKLELLKEMLESNGEVDLSQNQFKGIPQISINQLCKNECALKLGGKFLVKESHLSKIVLDAAKQKERLTVEFFYKNQEMSPDILKKTLNELLCKELLTESHNIFYPNFAKILSKENVIDFCKYRANKFSVNEVIAFFGCSMTVERPHEAQKVSEAQKHLIGMLRSLVGEGFLKMYHPNSESFFWNIARES